MTNSRELAEQVFERHRSDLITHENAKVMLTEAVDVGKKDILDDLDLRVVYIVWDMHADSWNGVRSVLGIFASLEDADASINDNIKRVGLTREPDDRYVRNYTYEAIEKYTLK